MLLCCSPKDSGGGPEVRTIGVITHMNQEAITIRKISDRDESRWRELFDAYNRFYGREPSEPLTQHTWRRIMDPTSSVHAIVAVDTANHVAGFANYIIHESTTRLTPLCYLQDLLVDQS